MKSLDKYREGAENPPGVLSGGLEYQEMTKARKGELLFGGTDQRGLCPPKRIMRAHEDRPFPSPIVGRGKSDANGTYTSSKRQRKVSNQSAISLHCH